MPDLRSGYAKQYAAMFERSTIIHTISEVVLPYWERSTKLDSNGHPVHSSVSRARAGGMILFFPGENVFLPERTELSSQPKFNLSDLLKRVRISRRTKDILSKMEDIQHQIRQCLTQIGRYQPRVDCCARSAAIVKNNQDSLERLMEMRRELQPVR